MEVLTSSTVRTTDPPASTHSKSTTEEDKATLGPAKEDYLGYKLSSFYYLKIQLSWECTCALLKLQRNWVFLHVWASYQYSAQRVWADFHWACLCSLETSTPLKQYPPQQGSKWLKPAVIHQEPPYHGWHHSWTLIQTRAPHQAAVTEKKTPLPAGKDAKMCGRRLRAWTFALTCLCAPPTGDGLKMSKCFCKLLPIATGPKSTSGPPLSSPPLLLAFFTSRCGYLA